MSNSEFTPVRPCIKCGSTERYKCGQCKPCKKAMAMAWQAANVDKRKALDAARWAANSDKYKAQHAVWRAANPCKIKANNASWAAANPEKVKAQTAAWRAANKDKAKASSAAWRSVNLEKVKARTAAWAAANPEARRIHDHNRRARKKASGGTLSKGLAEKLFKMQKGKCPCCNQPLGDDCHLDHKMPLALGGSNTDDNMQLLRKSCNLQKSSIHPVDFMQSRGFLL